MTEENEKEQKADENKNNGAANNIVQNGPTITFTKSDPAIVIDDEGMPTDPDILTKEELLQYVDDPYWKRIRWILLAAFWVIWFGMLVAAIVLIVLAPRCPVRPDVKWWEHSVVYKIHPKTFQDSDGDGVGDIQGITSRLDYLEDLTVKAIGLSAICPVGNDYDIMNHKEVDRTIGTMEDFKKMATAIHRKGMNLILDFMPTITSTNHTWFQQSQLGGSTNNYTDYYIWQKGAGGGNSNPPNGWQTKDGQSSWKYDNKRGEFYLFHENENQPMLNLKSEHVKDELVNVLQFWLDNGADGFRFINVDQPLENSRDAKAWASPLQPDVYELLSEVRNMSDTRFENTNDFRVTPFNKPARVLIVDAPGSPNQTAQLVSHGNDTGAQMVTNSALLSVDEKCGTPCIAKSVADYVNSLPKGFNPNWMLSDERHKRPASRTAEGSTRVAAMLLLTLPGAPFVLYGDEIAMKDSSSFNKNDTKSDPITPMQWSNEPNAGFTTNIRPWKAVNPTYVVRNVKAGTAHGAGTTDLEVFMTLSKLRSEPSFMWGNFERVHLPTPDIFAYVRQADGFKGYLVAMNFPVDGTAFTNSYADFHQAMPQSIPTEAEIVMTTENFPENRWTEYRAGMKVSMKQFVLQPGEGVVFALPWKHKIFSI